jgi:metal-sulfur cluster biosynthetic enzyme
MPDDNPMNCPDLPTEAMVWEALKTVIDPELGHNLVDLGLIYRVVIEDRKVTIQMTLTTQGCPMHESLVWGVRRAVLGLDPVHAADVQLVWDPPWQPSMMSKEAQERLGVMG